jgi:hypothetical protein
LRQSPFEDNDYDFEKKQNLWEGWSSLIAKTGASKFARGCIPW